MAEKPSTRRLTTHVTGAAAARSSVTAPLRAPCEATLLRIFIGDDDVFDNRPLYDQLVLEARTLGMAGATVTRGVLAYGPATIRAEGPLRLSEDLPIIVEIIDHEDNVQAFLAAADEMLQSAVVTRQKVSLLRYGLEPAP